MDIKIEILIEKSISTQLTFAYLFCERFYPNYVYFANNFSFGDEKIVRKSIDHLRNHIFDNILLTTEEIQKSLDDVYANTLDTENFTTNYASDALDACCIILNSFQFLIDRNFDHILHISRYGTDKVDRFILESTGIDVITPEIETFISNHPLMTKEITTQNVVITHLASNPLLSKQEIEYLLALLS